MMTDELSNEEAIKAIDEIKRKTDMFDDSYLALDMAIKALEQQPCEDAISRKDAVNALRKALYKYEDETEKQFKESKELNLEDWFQHRIFVQNMNDIDIQTILELPPVTSQPKVGHWVEMELVDTGVSKFSCSVCKEGDFYNQIDNPFIPTKYCPNCGADMRGDSDEVDN